MKLRFIKHHTNNFRRSRIGIGTNIIGKVRRAKHLVEYGKNVLQLRRRKREITRRIEKGNVCYIFIVYIYSIYFCIVMCS